MKALSYWRVDIVYEKKSNQNPCVRAPRDDYLWISGIVPIPENHASVKFENQAGK
jgi:hypothetical protein